MTEDANRIVAIGEDRWVELDDNGDAFPLTEVYVKIKAAFRQKALALLKGPKLSCFLCLGLHVDDKGEAYPSIDTIMRETGYSRPVVCNALEELKNLGFIEKHHRKHNTTLYCVKGYFWYGSEPKPTLLDEAQSKETLLPGSQSKASKRLVGKRLDSLPKDKPSAKEEPLIKENTCGTQNSASRRPDMFDLATRTEAIQQKEGQWTVPPSAGGADPFADGPVDAFCNVLAEIPPERLPPKKRKQWARKLRQIAEENSIEGDAIAPEDMTRAILEIPNSKFSFKTYSSPFTGNFDKDISSLLLRDDQPKVLKVGH